MKVKQTSFLTHLAGKMLHSNPKRRNLLFLSIILTCVLFSGLFFVMLGIMKSMEMQTMKTIGTISHGSFKELSKKDIDILSTDPGIKDYSIREKIGVLDNEKIMAELSYMDKKGMEWSLMENPQGRFPEKLNEVYVEKNTVQKLGYQGKIGEKIQIPYSIEKSYTSEVLEKKTGEFEICGTFENAIDSTVGVGQIYVSKAYADSLTLPEKNNDMEVMLKNSWKIKDQLLTIAHRHHYAVSEESGQLGNQEIRIGVNFAYFSNGDTSSYVLLLPGVFFLLLIFLSGFLIINNIFKISIQEDIRLFGQLKTMGMTKKQIKKLVHMESLLVALPSMMVGNLLGIFAGKVILNKIFQNNFMLADISLSVKSRLAVVTASVLFTLLTIFFSVMSPARKAAKISPIDATRYNQHGKKKRYRSRSISLHQLAKREVFGNPWMFLSIIVSMSLSAVILNSVLTYTQNMDIEKGLSDVIVTDYNLANPKYFHYRYYDSESRLKEKYIEQLKREDGFINGGAIYSYGTKYTYPQIQIEGQKVSPVLLGIDEYLLSKQQWTEGSFDQRQWESGNFVVIGEGSISPSPYTLGQSFVLNCNGTLRKLQVMGKINYNFANGLRYFSVVREDANDENSPTLREEYLYVSPQVYGEMAKENSIMSYGFDVEEQKRETFNRLLDQWEKNSDFSYDSRERQMESFQQYKNLIEFVGYSLSFILFLISVLNFTNIIATEILKNKINLSIMEAVGMTRRNLKYYLIKKSLLYSFNSFIFSLVLLIFVNQLVLKSFMASTKWTSYRFVFLPLIVIHLVNVIIGILFTVFFYERQSQQSLVDRIRDLTT